ncbi:hypothetical protein BGZ49_009010 [Haplosporangium sp. Z 27]|nr:hypothetical protein BGZ49_009010 [Haplosporangium sp. Z 27]
MKFTSIISLAVALCIVSANAATTTSKATTKATTKVTTTTKAAKKTTTTNVIHTTKATTKATKSTTTKATPKPTTTKVTPKPTTIKATSKATTTKTTPKPTSTAAPTPKDPCSDMAKAKDSNSLLSFNSVRDCYRAQSYKADVADKVLTSLENLIGNFYVFVDQAKAPSAAPFKTPRVDLMAGLKKIRATKWKSDYDFNMALTYLTFSANDGHLSYINDCYNTASFAQPISLYAPVENGVQTVRVFYADDTQKGVPKTGLVDCVVTEIDGVRAIKAIQDFTDRTSAISKDPGVRLNDALASTSWYNDWLISPGGFSKRWEVPGKATMDYTIKCGSGPVQKITVPWIVTPSDTFMFNTFKDTKSYWDVQCMAPLSPYNNAARNNNKNVGKNSSTHDILPGNRFNVAPATTIYRKRGTIKMPGGGKNGRGSAPKTILNADEVMITATTAFYKLKNSKACVAVIASEEAAYFKFDPSDYLQFIKGLEMLRDGGCKKLIFDMTNNGGGSVDFAYFINALFFPKDKPYFVEDLRDNSYVQGAAKAAVKLSSSSSIFDARGYNSMATRKPFKDASMFTKGVNYKRGGVTQTFTQKNYFAYAWPFLPLAKNNTLPWKTSDMAIVTNGFCGSACTMIATRFNIVHKVKTYAVGGIHNTSLSYFSFPGGFVMDNESIINDIQRISYKGKNGPSNFVVKATANTPVGEIYATENSTIPLEYDTKYFAANVHLDQDSVAARHPDAIWVKIAADFK